MNSAIELIAAERQRQIDVEGFDADHDDRENGLGLLPDAAAAYTRVAGAQARGATADEFPADMMVCEGDWPWDEKWWKPSGNPIRNLVKAGALIVAEIERLQRLKP